MLQATKEEQTSWTDESIYPQDVMVGCIYQKDSESVLNCLCIHWLIWSICLSCASHFYCWPSHCKYIPYIHVGHVLNQFVDTFGVCWFTYSWISSLKFCSFAPWFQFWFSNFQLFYYPIICFDRLDILVNVYFISVCTNVSAEPTTQRDVMEICHHCFTNRHVGKEKKRLLELAYFHGEGPSFKSVCLNFELLFSGWRL